MEEQVGRPFGQPAGGLRPEPAAQSQPIGAHQAQEEALAWLALVTGRQRERLLKARHEVSEFSKEKEEIIRRVFGTRWLQTANDAAKMVRIYEALGAIVRDRDEWREQHENLLSVRQSDLAVLSK